MQYEGEEPRRLEELFQQSAQVDREVISSESFQSNFQIFASVSKLNHRFADSKRVMQG